jgi:hypothetical protein
MAEHILLIVTIIFCVFMFGSHQNRLRKIERALMERYPGLRLP